MPDEQANHEADRAERAALISVRIVLPVAIALAGLILWLAAGLSALGLTLVGIAVLVWLADWLVRLGIGSERDRDREEEAREEFTETGRWPQD